MSNGQVQEQIETLIEDYIKTVRQELRERRKKWALDLTKREMHEVIGALVARQVTLVTHLAVSPPIWNGHIAPLILRSMTDGYIALAWIFRDPDTRATQFIAHGLGQEKLHLEHRRKQLEIEGQNPDEDPLIKAGEAWLNEQRLTSITEVNVGSWAGLDTRKMAEEADCIDLYNFAYTPFSSVTHNMWQHIAKYNLERCPNPLHRYHMIPIDRAISPDIDFLYRAAKYVEKTFKLFDEKTGIRLEGKSAFDGFVEAIERIGQQEQQKRPEERASD